MTERKLVRPSQLDIYHEPEENIPKREISRNPIFIYDAVSNVRQSITKVFSGLLTTHEKLSNFHIYVKTRGTDIYEEAQKDPYSLLVPGSVLLAAIGGGVVAGRGKRPIRRSIFVGLFGGTALAVTNHEFAYSVIHSTYHGVLSGMKQIYTTSNPKKTITEKVSKEPLTQEVENVAESDAALTSIAIPVEKELDQEIQYHVQEEEVQSGESSVVGKNREQETKHESTTNFSINPAESGEEHGDDSNDSPDNQLTNTHQKDILIITEESFKPLVEEQDGDFGQSDPSDRDMYSTRN